MGQFVGGARGDGRRFIAWTTMKRVEDTELTHFSGYARWRENIETTPLRGFARWRGKKSSYWLSCTHVTQTIPTILPKPSSNLETTDWTTIAGVRRKFITHIRNDKQDMPNHQMEPEK